MGEVKSLMVTRVHMCTQLCLSLQAHLHAEVQAPLHASLASVHAPYTDAQAFVLTDLQVV